MKVYIGKYPGAKSKKERVARVCVDDWDTWNLDHTLALIIAPSLRRMKEEKCGVPNGLIDYTHHRTMEWDSDEFKAADKKALDDGVQKWNDVLDQMIYAFEGAVPFRQVV